MAIEISNAIHAMAVVSTDNANPIFVGQGNVGFAPFGNGPNFSERLGVGRYRLHMLAPISIVTPTPSAGRGEGMIIAEALANAIAPSLSFLAAPASRVIVSVAGVSDILVEALTSTGAAFAGSTNYAEVLEDVTILPGASTDLPTVPITFAPNGSGRLDVLATVGWTPRLTTFHSVPANGVGDFIPVPSHAQSVTLLGTFAVGDITSVAAFTIPVTGAVLYQAASPTPNLDQFAFAIARGVEFIQLSNGTGQEIQVLLLWTIGL